MMPPRAHNPRGEPPNEDNSENESRDEVLPPLEVVDEDDDEPLPLGSLAWYDDSCTNDDDGHPTNITFVSRHQNEARIRSSWQPNAPAVLPNNNGGINNNNNSNTLVAILPRNSNAAQQPSVDNMDTTVSTSMVSATAATSSSLNTDASVNENPANAMTNDENAATSSSTPTMAMNKDSADASRKG